MSRESKSAPGRGDRKCKDTMPGPYSGCLTTARRVVHQEQRPYTKRNLVSKVVTQHNSIQTTQNPAQLVKLFEGC